MSKSKTIADLRDDYTRPGLSRSDLVADPFEQFRRWMHDAVEAGIDQPNAMTLATVSADGKPSARIVLLKEIDDEGFVFFTNYNGRKGNDLKVNPQAALVLFWLPLARQVRVEGAVHRISDEVSDEYFRTRPLGSRIGAWASPQSQVVTHRGELEASFEKYAQLYSDGDVPRPAHWGGYCLVPKMIEFWQGQPNRLHDRFRYLRTEAGWEIARLAP